MAIIVRVFRRAGAFASIEVVDKVLGAGHTLLGVTIPVGVSGAGETLPIVEIRPVKGTVLADPQLGVPHLLSRARDATSSIVVRVPWGTLAFRSDLIVN